jgi:hypothetical protein
MKAWDELPPPMFVPPAIPVLREFDLSEFLMAPEYKAWTDKGVAVETWIYPNEAHNFFQPKNRLRSMMLNADWFDFWLRGVKNSNPIERSQYIEWEAMRSRLAGRRNQ